MKHKYVIMPKKVNSSMKKDRITIDVKFHNIFNPPDSAFYVARKERRDIIICFNNKIFNGYYRYQGTKNSKQHLESIHYKSDLAGEIQKNFSSNGEDIYILFNPNKPNEFIIEKSYQQNLQQKLLKEDFEVQEGEITEETRKVIKRCNVIIKKAKEKFIQEHGSLYCEVCGFDFSKIYGELGKNFIEGHHKNPLCERNGQGKTKVADIALVCSNCHRMLHRMNNISVDILKNIIKNISRKDTNE